MNPSTPSNISPKRQVMETWFREVWGNKDEQVIDRIFPENGEATGLRSQSLVGPAEFKKFHAAMCALLDQIDIVIDHSIEEGDWISNLITIHAVSHISGKPVRISGNTYSRIDVENGWILEGYNNIDFMSLWNQMGFLPPDIFSMTGKG